MRFVRVYELSCIVSMVGADVPSSKDVLELRGTVEEALPAATFRIKLENGQMLLCHLSGKMRMHRIRLTPGDTVQVQVTPYDLTKGRIVFRL